MAPAGQPGAFCLWTAPASVDCQSRSPWRQANRTALIPTEYTVMYKRRTEPGEPPVRWLELVVDASKGTQATLSLLRPVPSLPPARPRRVSPLPRVCGLNPMPRRGAGLGVRGRSPGVNPEWAGAHGVHPDRCLKFLSYLSWCEACTRARYSY